MQSAVGGLPGERAGGKAQLWGDGEEPRGIGADQRFRGAVGAAGRARADRARCGAELEVHEGERAFARAPGRARGGGTGGHSVAAVITRAQEHGRGQDDRGSRVRNVAVHGATSLPADRTSGGWMVCLAEPGKLYTCARRQESERDL